MSGFVEQQLAAFVRSMEPMVPLLKKTTMTRDEVLSTMLRTLAGSQDLRAEAERGMADIMADMVREVNSTDKKAQD